MGFNTVAVIYNDHTHRIEKDGPIGESMAQAIRNWHGRRDDRIASHFGAGMIVSVAHADVSQVVIVGRNSGERAQDATDLDWYALEQMKECLERHGYRVTKPKKAAVQSR